MPTPRRAASKKKFSLFKLGFGLLLIPPSVAGSSVLLGALLNFQLGDPMQLAFATGLGAYAVMHLVLWKPIFMHVMGHELTHAFWAFLFGGRTKSLQVSSLGGQVTLSKTNFFVALAPYFFPFYTALLIPFFFITAPKYQPVISLLLGFTWSFHIALTLHSLREQQSDLHETGVVFSSIFIYFMNLGMLAGLLMLVAPSLIQPLAFVQDCLRSLLGFVNWVLAWWPA
jgi:hypothetical protein